MPRLRRFHPPAPGRTELKRYWNLLENQVARYNLSGSTQVMANSFLSTVVIFSLCVCISSHAAEKRGKIPGHMRFSEYTGYDAFDKETAVGALSDTSYKLPLYRSWPSKAYVVIGDVRHQDPRKGWREGEYRDAIKAALAVGGDAVILRQGSEAGVSTITGTASPSGVFAIPETTALVIRWQTEDEMRLRKRSDQALYEKLKTAYPNLGANEETGSVAIKYLRRRGVKDSAPEFFEQFVELFKRLRQTNDMLTGQWLFKATIKTGGIVSQTDRSFMGIAQIKVERESVAIVSIEGDTEASFSGTQSSGRLTGQLGLHGFSTKAEGVVIGDKISLTFQTTTQSGTVQGSFILQR